MGQGRFQRHPDPVVEENVDVEIEVDDESNKSVGAARLWAS